MKKEQTLHLIVIDDSSNHAESVSNMLRNGGHAVRAARVEDGEELRETLKDQAWDMILAKVEIPLFSALEAIAIVRDMHLDTPVVVLEDDAPRTKVMEALTAGARDAVSLAEPTRLEHVLMREWGDVVARRQHRACLRHLEEATRRAQTLVESSRDAIAYVHEGMYVYANDSYLQLFGYADFTEIEGLPLMSLVAAADQGRFRESLRRMGKGGTLPVRALNNEGKEFPVEMEFSTTLYEGEPCSQVVIRDSSSTRELEQRLDALSKRDLLTGLHNRRYFLEALHEAVNGGECGALVLLEPDRFAEVREEVGIARSDMVIADLAHVLEKALVGAHALLARFDGPAFAVLATGCDDEGAEAMARTLLDRVAEHLFEVGARTLSLTCSVGTTLFDGTLSDAQEVLRRADRARREAAEAGGNGVRTYNPVAEEMAGKERAALWARKLKLALRDNAFRLVYQPIVSLHGDPGERYEVYLRMVEEGKEINPIEFLAAAHQSGLMAGVDRWVLHTSVRTAMERHRDGKETTLFVNLSEASLGDPGLVPWLRELLKAARLDGTHLTVEIAESIAQAQLRNVKALVDGLRQLQVRTAIDHFGASATSHYLVKHIQPDYLKLDASLVADFTRNPELQRQVKELAALAKSVNCATVAEFVEDAKTLAALWHCGVDYVQGHFLQPPLPHLTYDFGGDAEG